MRFWAFSFIFLMVFSIQQTKAETLADSMISAYRNSNLLEQNRAVLRAADEDLATAVASLRPVFAYSATRGFSWANSDAAPDQSSTTFSLNGSLNLYDFGRGELAKSIKKEMILRVRNTLIGIEQDVLLAAVKAYIGVRTSQETVSLRQKNYRVISQELDAAKARFEVGEITQTDVAIAQSRLAVSRASLAADEGTLLENRESYKAATGAYPANVVNLPDLPKIPATLDEAIAYARANNIDLAVARHSAKIADLTVQSKRAALRPSLTAKASSDFDEEGHFAKSSASLTLSQNIYTGGSLASVVRSAVNAQYSAQAALRQAVVLVDQTVAKNWAALKVAQAGIDAAKLQIEASQIAYNGVREEASLGARTTLDVLNAEQDFLGAKDASLSAESRLYSGTYALLASLGMLTVDHLKLGIPTYDVLTYYDAVKNAPISQSKQGKKLDKLLKSLGK